MLLSVNEKKEEIFWDELPEHGDIADRVTGEELCQPSEERLILSMALITMGLAAY